MSFSNLLYNFNKFLQVEPTGLMISNLEGRILFQFTHNHHLMRSCCQAFEHFSGMRSICLQEFPRFLTSMVRAAF